jgi:hypothetical protein
MKCLLYTTALLCLFSCGNSSGETAKENDTTAAAIAWREAELTPEQMPATRQNYFVWDVDAESRTMKKNPFLQPEYFQVDTLIMGLNEKFPNIILEKKNISGDTLYTEIRDAAYFTEQSGSLGAEQYLAQAVLNLTAVQGINYVRIHLKKAAMPHRMYGAGSLLPTTPNRPNKR